VSAGSVDLEVRAPGYNGVFRTVNVPAGQNQTVVIRLEKVRIADSAPPPPPAPPPSSPWQRWAAIGAFAGGAVAAGVGTYGVIRFNDRVGSFNATCEEGPQGAQRKGIVKPDPGCARLQSEYRNARTLSIVGFSVAGALAATGVVFLLTAPHATDGEQKVGWACAPGVGALGLSCRTRF
jgi:hypothetical protein